MYRKVITLTLATATLGCAPLKEAHTEKHSELIIADSTLTRLIRSEIERSITTLTQTEVEFYPPQPMPEEPKAVPGKSRSRPEGHSHSVARSSASQRPSS